MVNSHVLLNPVQPEEDSVSVNSSHVLLNPVQLAVDSDLIKSLASRAQGNNHVREAHSIKIPGIKEYGAMELE